MKNKKLKIKNVVVFVVLFLLIPAYSKAAVYIVGGEDRTARVGEEIEIKMGVDTQGERLNLFQMEIDLPDNLKFTRFSKDGSATNLWVKEPEFNKKEKRISFVGAVPGGLIGRVVLASVFIKPLRPGNYAISAGPGSEAYLNDGLGTLTKIDFDGMNLKVEGRSSARVLPIVLGIFATVVILGLIIKIARKL